ncbi:MAG: hypothetical protein HYY46_14095 [Deltaproteobacteria bacterium]|nr:hypothetical protein [Deltaproteobacteria bacterium]
MGPNGHIYFHAPCFDGLVSAVLTWDFLEKKQDWSVPTLQAVNYDLRDNWLASNLARPCAVVDFLYHPDADFWADHHLTTFLTDAVREDFKRRQGPAIVYDDQAGSCAILLWEHLARAFDHRNDSYTGLVKWADKIDAARYDSVAEAIFPSAPALRISLGLVFGDRDGYCAGLVGALRKQSLEEVAELAEAKRRFNRALALIEAGLDRFKEAARLEKDGIVVFDVEAKDTIVSRYAPYYFYPEARYSAGILRWERGAKVTAMRNPWKEFEGVPLGKLCEELGGGGHRRVGSIFLSGERASGARDVLNRLLSEIRREEPEKGKKPVHGRAP